MLAGALRGVNRAVWRRVPAVSQPPQWHGRRLHFVGIGGIGMSGLALVADTLGASVTGSDTAARRSLARLRDRGIPVASAHAAENVPEGAEIVYSAAIPPDNPERTRARELGRHELRRGELLGELSALRRCIAVGGTHGKTTTAAMVVHALRGAGERPGYVVGGDLRATGTNADWGEEPWLVVEADESDRSFLALEPEIAVVTNVELEHLREFASREEVDDAFRAFLAGPRHAVVWDRPDVRALRDSPVVAFDVPDPVLGRGVSRFRWRGIEVHLPIPGEHNARNAAAALEACRLAGADPARAAAALADFPGTGRRFEALGATASGADVYDDYAHHPTEVRATLEAARTLRPKRLVAVLQPHGRYRVESMATEFGDALAAADLVVVLDLFTTRRADQDPGALSAEAIATAAAEAADGRPTVWLPDPGEAEGYLRAELRAGDACVALGSGDVDVLARRLVA